VSGKHNKLFPIIAGHEGAGIVESVGEGVTHLQPGDTVMFLFMRQCKKCRCCKAQGNFCLSFIDELKGLMPNGTSRFSCKGQMIYNFIGTSTFSEYTVVSVMNCVKINPNAPLEKVCLLACGVLTGYGGAVNTGKVRPGSICAVFGLGTIGLAAVLGCSDAKAGKVIAIDINSDKFALAKELGATDCINPKELSVPIEQYLMQTYGGGVDYTFECVGQLETMNQAWNSTVLGDGVCVIIGVPPSGSKLNISPEITQFGRTLMGSMYGGYKSRDDVPKLVDEYEKFKLDKFITHTMKLDKINEAIDLLKSGKSIRTVINFS
jgi:Zn-dependent alcohol dehydrogenase